MSEAEQQPKETTEALGKYDQQDYIASLTASMGKRFLNYFIDSILLYISTFFWGILLVLIGMESILDGLAGILTSLGMFFVYYAFTEGLTGRSPAKFITNTDVVTETGEKPDTATLMKRSLCRLIPFDALSYLHKNPIGWHDQFSDTMVIDLKKKQLIDAQRDL